jgi:hypothetical protein
MAHLLSDAAHSMTVDFATRFAQRRLDREANPELEMWGRWGRGAALVEETCG